MVSVGTYHDGNYLWSSFGEDGKLAVIDPNQNGCTLAIKLISRHKIGIQKVYCDRS